MSGERPIPEEWVEAACDVMAGPTDDLSDSERKALEHDARAVIAAVRPLIDEATRLDERERIRRRINQTVSMSPYDGREILDAIRGHRRRRGGRDAS